ncbi:MAG TPA: DUF4159 domain-containing protein [Candidatus Acidoferrales bacterium]|nr:DUF4159 domain-containing protein [Candidatus Acidoferrales bacterium]
MRSWKIILALCCLIVFSAAYSYAQRPFREYPSIEYGVMPLPPDWQRPGEWAFARLMYPQGPNDGYGWRDSGDWREGRSLWTQDYPPADRGLTNAVHRLTRIDTRSVEQCVDLDDGDEVYNWPWLYAVQVGEWGLTQHQADVLRDYLLRGGFFMADDFHGAYEWQMFLKRIRMVFPNRPIVEVPNSDAIFHTVFDLDDRYQVPGAAHLREGYKIPDYAEGPDDGKGAHWRAIYDDKGRIMVAISYNSDLGDSWEWSDRPSYPERYSALGFRIGINYIVYAMTH